MLFDIRPKERKEDLFDYDEEYGRLTASLRSKSSPLIAITGLRRTGKTSLMTIAFRELKGKKIFLDARMMGNSQNEISSHMLSELSKDDFFAKIIGRLDSIELPAGIVKLKLSTTSQRLVDVLHKADGQGGLVVFIDEAQLLKPHGFDNIIAYCYDHLRNIRFVLSGSEVGVLDKFLGKEDSSSALFGRAVETIRLNPLPSEKSVKFLQMGLRQIGKKAEPQKLEEIVLKLDGIAGWLAMFGWHVSKGNSYSRAAELVLSEGGKLVHGEVEKFLSNRPPSKKRYMQILSLIAREPASWIEIKDYLERKERKPINDKQVAKYLDALVDYGFVIKEGGKYALPDPVFRHLLL